MSVGRLNAFVLTTLVLCSGGSFQENIHSCGNRQNPGAQRGNGQSSELCRERRPKLAPVNVDEENYVHIHEQMERNLID